jgi:hypothetical protein
MLGIRYPLKMIPLLLFELVWKAIWLVTIALPLWRAGQIDPGTAESIKACVMGVIISIIAIPWPYFMAAYVKSGFKFTRVVDLAGSRCSSHSFLVLRFP